MNNISPVVITVVATLLSPLSLADTVTINHTTQRYLGSVSELDRGKYFVLHGITSDAEMDRFYRDFNVAKGRFFRGPAQTAKNIVGEVGRYPAHQARSDGNLRPVQGGLVSTEHPRDAIRYNTDLNAAAAWSVEYFKNRVSDGSRPEMFEPINEPFVHAGDDVFAAQQPNAVLMREKMADLFAAVGREFDQTSELANMKVIGYSSAWPSLEKWNFRHWNIYQKMFMDRAGEYMDGFATHLYDGINISGQDSLRSGSNSEAILDMIETYSYKKWGVVKPHAITEYGGIERGYGDDYSDIANAQAIRSFNQLIFNFLERQNDLLISIPFITDKSTWHLTRSNDYQPYGAVLLRPKNIGQANPKEWVYTPRVLFYDLWRAAKGKRVYIDSDNPDIQAQAFADGNKLFVALNNVDSATQSVNLDFVSGLEGLQNVRIKSLKVFEDRLPTFTNVVERQAPAAVTLRSGETVTLEYTLNNAIAFDNTVRSSKYYSDTYLQEIRKGVAQTYYFNGVDAGSGSATLRLSIGRKHNKSKSPIVRVNGTRIVVPANWAGYDQANRDDFFGTIEVPFSSSLLSTSNEVTVEFPDSDGQLASLILQVEKLDRGTPDPRPPAAVQQPYSGEPMSLPGKVEIEAYDLGGQDIAYNDSDISNTGPSVFREDEGVDIEARDGGISVGWTTDGEWLEYTVDADAGIYDLSLRFATISANKSVKVDLDGNTLGVFDLPATGGWEKFETITLPGMNVANSGTQILRLEFIGGDTNLNWLEFSSGDEPPIDSGDETVSCAFLPSTLSSSTGFEFAVDYSVNQSREVVVELWKGETFLAMATTAITNGVGIANLPVTVNSELMNGDDYLIKARIQPVGTDYRSAIDTCVQENITVQSCGVSWRSPDQSISKETRNWASAPIDISCANSVEVSMDVQGVDPSNMEPDDYLNIYYAVDGGRKIAVSEDTDGFALKNVSATVVPGSSLVLFIEGATSWQTEIYNIKNITVEGR